MGWVVVLGILVSGLLLRDAAVDHGRSVRFLTSLHKKPFNDHRGVVAFAWAFWKTALAMGLLVAAGFIWGGQ